MGASVYLRKKNSHEIHIQRTDRYLNKILELYWQMIIIF